MQLNPFYLLLEFLQLPEVLFVDILLVGYFLGQFLFFLAGSPLRVVRYLVDGIDATQLFNTVLYLVHLQTGLVHSGAQFLAYFKFVLEQLLILLHGLVLAIRLAEEFEGLGPVHELFIGQLDRHVEHLVGLLHLDLHVTLLDLVLLLRHHARPHFRLLLAVQLFVLRERDDLAFVLGHVVHFPRDVRVAQCQGDLGLLRSTRVLLYQVQKDHYFVVSLLDEHFEPLDFVHALFTLDLLDRGLAIVDGALAGGVADGRLLLLVVSEQVFQVVEGLVDLQTV